MWLEYEEESTYEASIAKQLDKFEMIVQADEYEKANSGTILDSFFQSTMNSFTHPEVSKLSLSTIFLRASVI